MRDAHDLMTRAADMTSAEQRQARLLAIERRRHPVLVTTTCQVTKATMHRLERIERKHEGWIPVYRCLTTRTLRPFGLHKPRIGIEALQKLYGPLVWDEWRTSLLAQPLEGWESYWKAQGKL